MWDFNMAVPTHCLAKGLCQQKTPPSMRMTSTKIELASGKIGRIADLADLAEILFPGNRNQQHAFLVIWIALKWRTHIVPNLAEVARVHGISRRTYERVRAKLRRLGLIEPVSRFGPEGHDGWTLSTRFERGVTQLVRKIADLKDTDLGANDKDLLLIQLALARRDISRGAERHTYKEVCASDRAGMQNEG
jgi:hypothetical protein